MHPNEKYRKQEVDPNRILEQHLKGLRKTSELVTDFRMRSRLGSAGIQEGQVHGRRADGPADFARAAKQYTKTLDPRDPGYRDAKMYATILGTTPSMIAANKLLQRREASKPAKYKAKLDLIGFNNGIKDIVNTNPSIEPFAITGLVKSATIGYGYRAEDINLAVREAEERQVGVKHELGFEAPLYYLPEGFEIMDTTDEDDKKGIDYRIRCRNGEIVTVDVKASQELADKAIQEEKEFSYMFGHGGQPPKNKLILFSGYTMDDFDPRNPWRPKPEAVERVYPTIERALIEASGEEYIPAPLGVR
jgi:hypothetical protein